LEPRLSKRTVSKWQHLEQKILERVPIQSGKDNIPVMGEVVDATDVTEVEEEEVEVSCRGISAACVEGAIKAIKNRMLYLKYITVFVIIIH